MFIIVLPDISHRSPTPTAARFDYCWVKGLILLFVDAPETLKESSGNRSKDEAANVSRISDAATRLYICHGADLTEELNQKPESDQERRGNKSNAGPPAEQKQRAYPIMRVGDQKGAHHTRNRATGAQIGNGGTGA